MKTIAFISVSYPNPLVGGIEAVHCALAEEFMKRGYRCMAVHIFPEDSSPTEYNVFKEVHYVGIGGVLDLNSFVKENNISFIMNGANNNEEVDRALRTFTDRGSCRVLSVFHNKPGYEGIHIRENVLHKKPKDFGRWLQKVLNIIRYPQYYKKRFDRIKRLKLNDIMYSDKVVLLSDGFKEEFMSIYDIPEEYADKICAVGNPLRFQYKPGEVDFSSKNKEVLIVSRLLETQKKLSLAFKIWARIEADERFDDWTLTVVGSGPSEVKYRSLVKDLKLSRVTFEGTQLSLPYYQRSSIFMMTSHFEGFGVTLTESMQNGVVPLAFDTYAALHDIITDGEDGFILPYKDIKGYVEKMKMLMSDAKLREQMAQRGLENVSKFSIEAIADKWEELFSETI